MHDRDLRRQALESGKTVSRKQKAKHLSARSSQAGSASNSPFASPAGSPGGSRAASRNPSRQVSEDEDDDSDELASRCVSLDLHSEVWVAKRGLTCGLVSPPSISVLAALHNSTMLLKRCGNLSYVRFRNRLLRGAGTRGTLERQEKR